MPDKKQMEPEELESIARENNKSHKTYIIRNEEVRQQLNLSGFEPTEQEKENTKEPIKNEIHTTDPAIEKKPVGRPPIDETFIKKTFLITQELDKAIKFKAVNEGKNISELVREILENGIEKKYFKGL